MFEHLADQVVEFEDIEARLPDIYSAGDQEAARDANRRYAELKPLVDAYRD